MINIEKFLKIGFHLSNIVLIIFYLYPGSIFGHFLYNDTSIQPQITRDFLISSNHFYVFIVISSLGIFAYQNTQKIKITILYLYLLSIILEMLHILIPNRGFELMDLFGNIAGVIFIVIIYKVKKKYV